MLLPLLELSELEDEVVEEEEEVELAVIVVVVELEEYLNVGNNELAPLIQWFGAVVPLRPG